MDFRNNLEIKQNIQRAIIEYIDDGCEDSYIQLIDLINNLKIEENPMELKDLLQLINSLCNNHHRSPYFFKGIEIIILKYKSNIQRFLSNKENLDISSFNLRLLLLLHQEKIISINDHLPSNLSYAFRFYFSPEIEHEYPQNFNKYNGVNEDIDPEKFEKLRKIGENHSYICSLIRNDSIEEFVSFVNQSNYPLSSTIDSSPFETNEYLMNRTETSLIEYSAFFGSVQIFQFLKLNNIELTPSLWPYVIHSNNAEMIHLLEENHVAIADLIEYRNISIVSDVFEPFRVPNHKIISKFIYLMIESIKCHHNDIFNYFLNNFDINKNIEQTDEKLQDNNLNDINRFTNFLTQNIAGLLGNKLGFLNLKKKFDILFSDTNDKNTELALKDDDIKSLQWCIFSSFNYIYFPEEIDDNTLFSYFVTYGYTTFVKYFLNEKEIDINAIVILNFLYFYDITKKIFY